MIKKEHFNKIIKFNIFFYVLSLYVFSNRTSYTIYSNLAALSLMLIIIIYIIIFEKKVIVTKSLKNYFVFLTYSLLSYLYSINKSLVFSKFFTLFQLYLIMFLLVQFLDSLDKIYFLMKSYAWSGLLAIIYMVFIEGFGNFTRYGSSLGNVNTVGMMLGIAAIFSYYLISLNKMYIIFFIFNILFVLMTGSRKAFIFVTFSLLLISYLNSKRIKQIVINLIRLTIVFFALYYLVNNFEILYFTIGRRLNNLIDLLFRGGTTEGSLNSRSEMILLGYRWFKNKPILGYGLDNYRELYRIYNYGYATYAHNNYIELLVDLGILGFTIYYYQFITIMRGLYLWFGDNLKIANLMLTLNIVYLFLGVSLIYYDNKSFILIQTISISLINLKSINECSKRNL